MSYVNKFLLNFFLELYKFTDYLLTLLLTLCGLTSQKTHRGGLCSEDQSMNKPTLVSLILLKHPLNASMLEARFFRLFIAPINARAVVYSFPSYGCCRSANFSEFIAAPFATGWPTGCHSERSRSDGLSAVRATLSARALFDDEMLLSLAAFTAVGPRWMRHLQTANEVTSTSLLPVSRPGRHLSRWRSHIGAFNEPLLPTSRRHEP